MPKITFTPMTEEASIFYLPPRPSTMFLPEWYKNFKLYVGTDKEYGIHKEFARDVNTTLKACTPFLDAMTTGYMVELASDIEFSKEGNQLQIKFRTDQDLIGPHLYEQTYNLPRTNNEFKDTAKWLFDWKIETPKGYSCLYTHPLNRSDLPFRTLSGVVDTDRYPDSVHFPFQMIDFDHKFILEKGTPICQVFPFKRENWESSIEEFQPLMKKKAAYEILSKIKRSYKKQYWVRKSYR